MFGRLRQIEDPEGGGLGQRGQPGPGWLRVAGVLVRHRFRLARRGPGGWGTGSPWGGLTEDDWNWARSGSHPGNTRAG